jgi:hypothetical protein
MGRRITGTIDSWPKSRTIEESNGILNERGHLVWSKNKMARRKRILLSSRRLERLFYRLCHSRPHRCLSGPLGSECRCGWRDGGPWVGSRGSKASKCGEVGTGVGRPRHVPIRLAVRADPLSGYHRPVHETPPPLPFNPNPSNQPRFPPRSMERSLD